MTENTPKNEDDFLPPDEPRSQALVSKPARVGALMPETVDGCMRMADLMARADILPPTFQKRPANCFLAIEMAREMNVGWFQIVQNAWVDKGKINIFGDLPFGIVKKSGQLEYIKEWEEDGVAWCEVKRKNDSHPVRAHYSMEDAQLAGLLSKDNWEKRPRRMKKVRARSEALRDAFPDLLSGLGGEPSIIDESDIPKDVTPVTPVEMPTQTNQEQQSNSDAGEVLDAEIVEKKEEEVTIDNQQRMEIFSLLTEAKLKQADLKKWLQENLGVSDTKKITIEGFETVTQWLKSAKKN